MPQITYKIGVKYKEARGLVNPANVANTGGRAIQYEYLPVQASLLFYRVLDVDPADGKTKLFLELSVIDLPGNKTIDRLVVEAEKA